MLYICIYGMIKLNVLISPLPLYKSALRMANKIAFDHQKGFVTSWDQQTYWEFAKDVPNIIKSISKDPKSYVFSPYVLRELRLKNKTRKIFISTWADRLVESTLASGLATAFSKRSSRRSYAYRPDGIGLNDCQKHFARHVSDYTYFSKMDVEAYFYTIDHELLIDKLNNVLPPEIMVLLLERIKFAFYNNENRLERSTVGVPFGSPLACVFANYFFDDIDKVMERLSPDILYYRYADDILIAAKSNVKLKTASDLFKDLVAKHKLGLNHKKCFEQTFVSDISIQKASTVKFLGLEFGPSGSARLAVEKRRKIMNIARRCLESLKTRLKRITEIDKRLEAIINTLNDTLLKRIRYAAIIDYYLNHVTDEAQLRTMDLDLAKMVLSTIFQRPFRNKLFSEVSFKRLRQFGLISFVHRSRLLKHGQIRVPFLSMFNRILIERHLDRNKRHADRINRMRLARKCRMIDKI